MDSIGKLWETDYESITLLLFTFYWNKKDYQDETMTKWVKWSNFSHIMFILYTVFWISLQMII